MDRLQLRCRILSFPVLATAGAALLLGGLGWWAGNRQAANAETRMRAELLNRAQGVVDSLDANLVNKLGFVPSDKGTAAFEELRKQMTAVAGDLAVRGIFTLARRGGRMYFGPESYAEDDPVASPPGTEYRQPPAGLLAVFDDKRAATIGPYTDEYGTFTTAVVPMLDPSNHAVLMLVGVDALAGQWQAEIAAARRGPLWTALALLLLFAGGAAVVRRRNRLRKPDTLNLRGWIVVPSGLAVLLGLALYGIDEYRESADQPLAEMTRATERVRREWDRHLAAQAQLLKAQVEHVAGDPRLLKAWQARDPAKLAALARPEFEQLKREYGITYFYFIAPDRVCFLRVHQPDRRGDRIDRHTLLRAEQLGEDSWGAELGSLGTFTLRYVKPWKQDGRTIGYLELGTEISQLAQDLSKDLGLDIVSVVGKRYTTREKFEAGRRAFGFSGQWDTYPDFAVMQQTTGQVPPDALSWLRLHDEAAALPQVFGGWWGRRRYFCGIVHLRDCVGRNVAHLMALRDATAQVASLRDQRAMRIGVAAVLFAGLLALLWSITGAAERQLAAAFLGTRESEARFRSLFDNAIAGMAVHEIVLDERGKPADYIYVQANRGFETHTGLRIADVLGRRATEVFAGGGEAPLIDDYGKVVLTGEPATLERYFEPLERHYHIGAYRVAPGRFATVFLDITERKRMEQALQTERDNLKAIFAASPVGMLLLDEDTVITDCNGVIARAVSRDPGQILRRRAGNGLGCIHSGETEGGCGFAPACQQCRLRQGIVQVLKGGTSLHGAEIHASLLINGEQRRPWLKVSAQPVVLNGRRHVVVAVDDITEHKALEEELRTAARLDRLTGLPNRALFLDRLQRAVVRRRQSRKEPAYAVLFLDFDRFKIINDSLGHDAGDRLLCEIARRLRETLGVVDSVSSAARGTTAARLGGDEFVVLLDSLESPAEAQAVAERLLDALGAPYQLDGREVVSTASIGIVKGEYDYERADDVLRDADTAMYEAKLAGKGRALMFDGSMRERVQRKLELESGLRRGLDSGQFILHYQPIISLESGRIEGFEALVRWQHPEHGMVSPGEFIPVAEETGLIVPLGEWVFREACRQRAAWQAMLGRDATPSLSVNLSRNQLASAGLPRRLVEIAAEAGVDPQSIHLEVTESAIMSDTKLAADVLRELKTVGFRVDMDDFGTGYSSLACLHQFPIDVLKIDRSFIANLDRGRDFAALVNAIAMLARNLGIEVVAEGVETPDQVTMLQSLECQLAQGYYFARPMPADQVLAYCRNGRKAAA